MLIWGNVAHQIGMPNMSASAMSTSIRPVYWVVWNRAIVDNVTTERINDELSRIRNSSLPTQEYPRLVAMFLEAYRPSKSLPEELRACGQTAERSRLDSTFGWGPILEMRTFLRKKGDRLPVDLGRLPPAQLRVIFEGCPSPQLLRTFWSITRSSDSYPASADYVTPDHTAFTQDSLAKAVKSHSKQFASTGKIRVRTANRHHLPRSFGRLGAAQKIKTMQAAHMAPRAIDRFGADADKADLLKQVRGSLPGVASALRRYAALCELRQTPPPPR